ncbi:hypothetical protein HPB51_007268 [Rhipicephalus microplus]|uniref:RRM domain-containing protein n=1 Tax=Rhipicephalus microplus TaxID=6941 RepID=A0A9J6E086_RHIMP|nr:hypothetical protein HPB51_007268 [Rhipicephalus microplus]
MRPHITLEWRPLLDEQSSLLPPSGTRACPCVGVLLFEGSRDPLEDPLDGPRPTRLNVYKNDNDSWDYTNPNLGKSGSERPALLGEPRGFGNYKDSVEAEYDYCPEGDGRGPASGPGYGPDRGDYDYGPRGGQYNSPGGGYNDGYGGPPNGPPQDRYGGPPHDGRDGPNYGMGGANASPQAAGPHQGSVLMVYGLNSEKMNAEKLFNLLCLYGNVVRIKFLKSKDGCAMVQMGDPLAVERAVGHLNNAQFFDTKMQLGYSKQAFLNDVQLPFELPDGTPSFKDFMGNRNNRFTNPEAASKNRIQPPSRVLHFFNTPFGITDEDLKKVYIKLFEDLGCPVPTTIKMFTSKTERSSSGLMEFETVSEAIEALIMSNHTPINNPSKYRPSLRVAPPRWSSGYGTRLLTRRSRDRIPVAVAAFPMEAEMLRQVPLHSQAVLLVIGAEVLKSWSAAAASKSRPIYCPCGWGSDIVTIASSSTRETTWWEGQTL